MCGGVFAQHLGAMASLGYGDWLHTINDGTSVLIAAENGDCHAWDTAARHSFGAGITAGDPVEMLGFNADKSLVLLGTSPKEGNHQRITLPLTYSPH